MIPEKNTKNESDENSPFDIYSAEYSTRFACENNDARLLPINSAVEVKTNSNTSANTLNKNDDDDEEDFISKYFVKINYADFQNIYIMQYCNWNTDKDINQNQLVILRHLIFLYES